MHAQTQATAGDDLEQLRTLEKTFATAFNNKDADAAMAVYAPGKSLFVYDVVGPPGVYFSSDEYREALSRFLATFSGMPHFTISDLDVETSADVGYGRSLQHVSGIRARDGKPLNYTVRVTNVYRRIEGKWLIVQEHVSLPLDRNALTPLLHTSLDR